MVNLTIDRKLFFFSRPIWNKIIWKQSHHRLFDLLCECCPIIICGAKLPWTSGSSYGFIKFFKIGWFVNGHWFYINVVISCTTVLSYLLYLNLSPIKLCYLVKRLYLKNYYKLNCSNCKLFRWSLVILVFEAVLLFKLLWIVVENWCVLSIVQNIYIGYFCLFIFSSEKKIKMNLSIDEQVKSCEEIQ